LWISLSPEDGPICYPETSVRNYHYSLRNNHEERYYQLSPEITHEQTKHKTKLKHYSKRVLDEAHECVDINYDMSKCPEEIKVTSKFVWLHLLHYDPITHNRADIRVFNMYICYVEKY
jgi:hypothetical protein